MIRHMRLLSIAFLFTLQLAAGDAARDARWQQDVNYLAAQLPVKHPDFYLLVPQAQFSQAVGSLTSAIPNLNDTEVMVGLAAIVAMANDGHTNLFLTQRNSAFHQLPLRFQWFHDGLFVTGADDAHARALGAKVLLIGDRSTDDAYAAVAPTISHENDIWVRFYSPFYFANADILQALKIAPSNAQVHFVFQDLTGTQFAMDVDALAPGQTGSVKSLPDGGAGFVPLYQQNTNLNYWFTYVPSSRLLYFAYNSCANMANLPFTQFNSQLWAAFDANPVETFVLDLRNNSGGNSAILDPFFASAGDRTPRFAKVRSYVIVGRETYSSAILNAITLQQAASGQAPPLKLVGEPTGGSPNSYGQVQTMVLPNSQLSVNYSTRYFSFPMYPPGSMLPDVFVPMASADYFARHDPFLAAVLADAPRNSDAATGASPLAVANAATLRADLPVAPGSLATAFGDFPGVVGAASLGLFVNGTPAPLLAVLPDQINFQMPWGTPSGTAIFEVRNGDAVVTSGTAAVAASAPGLFRDDPTAASRPAAALDQNSQIVGAGGVGPGGVLQLFGTGQGGADPSAARVYFGSEQAEVTYSGTNASSSGLWQIDVKVPDKASVSGQVPVFVTVGTQASNGVTVRVNR